MTELPSLSVLGIDVGGANIKYALIPGDTSCIEGKRDTPRHVIAHSTVFPMWKDHERLADQLIADFSLLPMKQVAACGVTMTGELADCFFDRREGVVQIVHDVSVACQKSELPDPLYYGVDGAFRTSLQCVGNESLTAASNWHGLANYIAATDFSDGLLLDIGSTTTDLIPIRKGCVATNAITDFDRLSEGSLVYLGGERTSIAMMVESLLIGGKCCPVMREHFATMKDVRVILGLVSESVDDCDTADGKPCTMQHCMNRLARILGLGFHDLAERQAVDLAKQVHDAARLKIEKAFNQITERYGASEQLMISGHSDDLVPILGQQPKRYLREVIGVQGARNAPAVAIAGLLQKRIAEERCAAGSPLDGSNRKGSFQ